MAYGWDSENAARNAMLAAEERWDLEVAAIAALHYSDYVGTRSAEGAANINQRAMVYATLHLARSQNSS